VVPVAQLARSLDDILKEIDAGYAPQRQSLQTRLDALPKQAESEIAGLKATQEQAFGEILGGARDRGMGFSGVPLAEQARYTASSFLPAVARVRQTQNEARMSLLDALNNINLDQRKYATSIYQQELDREEQQRQFNERLAAERAAAASAAQANPLAGLFGGGQQQPPPPPDPYASVDKQSATNAIRTLLNTGNRNLINRTITAITKSANNGNLYDKFKLELIDAYRKNSAYGKLLSNIAAPAPTKLPSLIPASSGFSDPLLNRLTGGR
jgi:hypothetical protein